MHYVYVLRSMSFDEIYVGQTNDVRSRLADHNNGKSKHTSKYKPWEVIWYASFESKTKAIDFEKYLKSASGKAFLRKRLIDY